MGMSFEDALGYFIVFMIFVLVFIPMMGNAILVAQATADPLTAYFMAFIIPLVLLVMIVGWFKRASGGQPIGEW